MSLTRRWLDPIRSRWFINRPLKRSRLSPRSGLVVYLRLDDAYSYLAVQILHHLDEILQPKYRPLKVVVCTQAPSEYPNNLTADAWLRYTLKDAQVLAAQHRFIFQPQSYPPDTALMAQALLVLRHTHLTGSEYLHLLQNVFHMLWQRQTGKLETLWVVTQRRAAMQSIGSDIQAERISERILPMANIRFGGRNYRAIDDLLRLTRRLQRYQMLSQEPVFLIDHVEWQEHLVNDPVTLAHIQACHAELHLYIALEDPFSWLILAYLKRDMVDYYNVQLKIHPLPYQHRDDFDWSLAARLSQRVDVPFAPFCRPDAEAVMKMATVLYGLDPEHHVDVLLGLLNGVWSEGLDPSFSPHFFKMFDQPHDHDVNPQHIKQWLAQHQLECERLQLPELPAMVLRIGQDMHSFSGLYRVWRVETLLAQAADRPEDMS
jgi:hypothetical protein